MTTNNKLPKTTLCFYAVNILTHDKAYPFQNVYQFHSLYLKFNNDKNPKNSQPPKTPKLTKNFPHPKQKSLTNKNPQANQKLPNTIFPIHRNSLYTPPY